MNYLEGLVGDEDTIHIDLEILKCLLQEKIYERLLQAEKVPYRDPIEALFTYVYKEVTLE
jgi:hypothetical protein